MGRNHHSVATPGIDPVDDFEWELSHVAEDFSQANDLADENPDKLAELQDLFMEEAEKYDVLPLDNSKVERLDVSNRPSLSEGSAPDLRNKSFGIAAEMEIPDGGAEGVLMTQGGRFSGVGLGGLATLSVDGNSVASERIEHSIGYRISLDETLDIGEDTGTPVSEDYHVPFKFTGEIEQVKIAITDEELTEEQLREMRKQLGRYVP